MFQEQQVRISREQTYDVREAFREQRTRAAFQAQQTRTAYNNVKKEATALKTKSSNNNVWKKQKQHFNGVKNIATTGTTTRKKNRGDNSNFVQNAHRIPSSQNAPRKYIYIYVTKIQQPNEMGKRNPGESKDKALAPRNVKHPASSNSTSRCCTSTSTVVAIPAAPPSLAAQDKNASRRFFYRRRAH